MGLRSYLSLPRHLLQREALEERSLSAAERMLLAIQELGPTFIKFGQILSTRPDFIPPDYLAQLVRLQDKVPPAPWELIEEEIEGELGAPLGKLFSSFETEPIAAASLGQVYSATLPSGEEVVIKARRPGIEEVIEVDLEILHDLARLAQEHAPQGEMYELPEIAEEFAFTLRNEMDYLREGRNADRFRQNLAGEPYVYIPKIYWDHTTSKVLTLERIRGIKIDDIKALDAAGIDRHQVALNRAHIIIKEVMEEGFFHADPHPGNFFVMEDEVIGVMDFGMVGHLLGRDRRDLIRLYVASTRLDSERIVDYLIRIGAVGHGFDRRELERDIRQLLIKYRSLPLKDIHIQEVMEEVSPVVFRHHLRLPSQLWLLGKTLSMIEGIIRKLDPDFDVLAASKPYAQRFARQRWMPESWGPSLLRSATDWAELMALFPRQASHILDRMERGDFEMYMSLRGMERVVTKLDRIANRLAISILVAAFIVSLALLMPILNLAWPFGLMAWLIIAGFVAASLLGLWLLVSIWRAG